MRPVAYTLILFVLGATPNLDAQDERVRVSGITAIAVGDGGPATAISAQAGFQLAPHAGFEIEALYIPDQDFGRSPSVVLAIYPPSVVETDGGTIAFLTSFVTDLQVGRLRPYAEFGGGIANVRRTVTIEYPPSILTGSTFVSSPAGVYVSPVDVRLLPFPRGAITSRTTENDLALAAGAGLDIRIWKRLSVAADVRYLRLFQTTPGAGGAENITRVGARAAWWF